jgi:hypothetical protein
MKAVGENLLTLKQPEGTDDYRTFASAIQAGASAD